MCSFRCQQSRQSCLKKKRTEPCPGRKCTSLRDLSWAFSPWGVIVGAGVQRAVGLGIQLPVQCWRWLALDETLADSLSPVCSVLSQSASWLTKFSAAENIRPRQPLEHAEAFPPFVNGHIVFNGHSSLADIIICGNKSISVAFRMRVNAAGHSDSRVNVTQGDSLPHEWLLLKWVHCLTKGCNRGSGGTAVVPSHRLIRERL
jgi:hypothetical protein